MISTISLGAAAWTAPRQLHRAQAELSTSVARLSSGMRINEARDDAAGLGISVRLGSEARASRQVTRGVNDGIGLVQTAEAALGDVASKVQRARELAVQAASGHLLPGDRAALAQEYAGLMRDIDDLARSTRIFGIYPLVGPVAGSTPHITDIFPSSGSSMLAASGIKPVAYVPAGARNVQLDIDSFGRDDDIQIFTRDGRHLVGTPLGDVTWAANGVTSAASMQTKVLTSASGFDPGATYSAAGLLDGSTAYANPASSPPTSGITGSYGGMNFVYSGDGDRHDGTPNDGSVAPGSTLERVRIDQVTEPLIMMVVGSGQFNARASWSSMPGKEDLPRTGPTEIVVNASVHASMETVTVPQTPADLSSLGLTHTSLSTQETSAAALSALDAALETVSGHRATMAGVANRFERVSETLATQSEQASSAQSRILDADYAAESAAMTRSKVLADASRAMLAQANSSAETALSLLRTR